MKKLIGKSIFTLIGLAVLGHVVWVATKNDGAAAFLMISVLFALIGFAFWLIEGEQS